jgi:hypothetical protein
MGDIADPISVDRIRKLHGWNTKQQWWCNMFKMTLEIADGEYGDPIPMREMEPCQIAEIIGGRLGYFGSIVMRTASVGTCEVMDLSHPGPDNFWDYGDLLVRPLPVGSKITLEVV